MLRAQEPGWIEIGQADTAGRRSLWVRFGKGRAALELCAGREGDDASVIIGSDNHDYRGLTDVMRFAEESARSAKAAGAPSRVRERKLSLALSRIKLLLVGDRDGFDDEPIESIDEVVSLVARLVHDLERAREKESSATACSTAHLAAKIQAERERDAAAKELVRSLAYAAIAESQPIEDP